MTVPSVAINLLWLVPGEVGGSEESTLASLRGLIDLAPNDLDLRLLVLEPFRAAHPDVVAALPTDVLPLSGRSRAARVGGGGHLAGPPHAPGRPGPPRRGHRAADAGRGPTCSRSTTCSRSSAAAPTARPSGRTSASSCPVRCGGPASWSCRASSCGRRCWPAPASRSERVVVVPHGVERHPAPTPRADLEQRYHLDGPVILYPAITYPHKNHAAAHRGVRGRRRRSPAALLVLPGREDSSESALRARIASLGLTDRVRRLGRVPAADVAGLYELAAVVAVPSRYEGFGLPVAEAMAYGTPVVAATGTSLPEVVGDAGILLDPDDAEGWTAALLRLLGDAGARDALVAAGRARAASLGPSANARLLTDVYRAALAL